MKFVFLLAALTFTSTSFAAIGCLPGDCCNNRPCGPDNQPLPPPPPRNPGCRGNFQAPLETLNILKPKIATRSVENCSECSPEEVCAEFSTFNGDVIGHSCQSL